MAVKIRLRRMGAKKAPFYDPTKDPVVVNIDGEKAKQWIANGAQPTDTVRALLKKSNIL